jgi:O-antigen/teichoic acid export membrane protein
MGTIRKQSIAGTIIIYIGVVIGFVNTGILLPKILSTDQIGLINVLVAYATIFAQFSSLGFNNVITRLFPFFRNKENGHNGFLGLGLSVIGIGTLVGIGVFYLLQNVFISNGSQKAGEFPEYSFLVIPLFIFILLFLFLDTYLKALYRASAGLFLKEVLQRLVMLVSIICYAFDVVKFDVFLLLYFAAYFVPVLIAVIMLIRSGDFRITRPKGFINPSLKKELISMSAFGIIAGFMGVITINIDRLMIERFLGLSLTGIYSTAFFFGTVVAMPARAVTKISTTFLADSWKNNDLASIRSVFNRTATTQFIFGCLVFGGLIINLDNIFYILGAEFEPGRWVILFIGLAYLTDMSLGVGSHILLTTKYFRVQTYLLLVFMAIVIITNLIFIPKYGILGAAFASFLSKFVHDMLKVFIIKQKLNLFPYRKATLYTVVITVVFTVICYMIPESGNLFLNIGIRSTLFVLLYLPAVYFLRLSPDINSRFDTYLGLIFKKKQQ